MPARDLYSGEGGIITPLPTRTHGHTHEHIHPLVRTTAVLYSSTLYSSKKAQYTGEQPLHQQPTNTPWVYNSSTPAIHKYSRKKQKQKKQRQGDLNSLELTLCLSRIDRSTS